MSHGATVGGQTHTQTRKQANAGKKTGVAGRRSRWTKEGKIGGLGQAVKRHYSKDHPPAEAIRSVETFWNNLSHEWFGTNKNTFPYTIDKGKPSNFELAQYGAKKLRKTMPMDHPAKIEYDKLAGGDDGGEIIAVGTPEQIIKETNSYTGKFLKEIIIG